MSITSLDKFKRFLQITDSSQDTFLQELLDRAEKKIETVLETKFYSVGDTPETITETHYGYSRIILPEFRPVISVSSVKIDEEEITDYIVYPEMIMLDIDGREAEISYTAGFVGIPEDLEQAIILTAANYLKINSELQPNQNVDYRMPQEVKDLIQLYRRVVL